MSVRPGARLRFSVIVVSRGRPRELDRCLKALAQVDHPDAEVVVVADSGTLKSVSCAWVRSVGFDEMNISAARNAGIAASTGEICAFIDDDAVPEPMWLRWHEDALMRTGAAASVGFVRGRNGIGFQSRLESIDLEAETHREAERGEAAQIPVLVQGRAVKLVGTNMAVRREALLALGGFDPALRYYLDDSDLSLRLAKAGFAAAVAPLAEVHHAMAASERRTRLMAPRSLFDIGRSTAIFLRRHPGADPDEVLERLTLRERRRLVEHMVRGTCEPGDVARLLRSLEQGWSDGARAALPLLALSEATGCDRITRPDWPHGHQVFSARLAGRSGALRRASFPVREGRSRATVISYSLTKARHRVRFTDDGTWLHTGGVFGPGDRLKPHFKWCRFASRVRLEIARVAKQRGMDDIATGPELGAVRGLAARVDLRPKRQSECINDT